MSFSVVCARAGIATASSVIASVSFMSSPESDFQARAILKLLPLPALPSLDSGCPQTKRPASLPAACFFPAETHYRCGFAVLLLCFSL
jgi:hypothetical protein